MVKRLFCLVLTLVLAMSLCTPVAMATADESEILERFCVDWVQLAYYQYDRIMQENKALDAISAFCESRTWDDLVRARACCAYTVEIVQHYSSLKAEPGMTSEEYQALEATGLDVGDVQAEYTLYNTVTLKELANVTLPKWQGYYQANLFELYCMNDIINELATSAQLSHQYNDLTLQYLYLVNNIILLQLPEQFVIRLNDLVQSNMPMLMKEFDIQNSNENDALNEIQRVTEQLEELSLAEKEQVVVGYVNYENLNFDDIAYIEDSPETMPFPSFLDSESCEYLYYWKTEDGTITAPSRDMCLDPIPNCMNMTMRGVAAEQFKAYIVDLSNAGFKPASMSDTVAQYTFADGKTLFVSLENDTMSLSLQCGQLCLVPFWYQQVNEKR